MEINRNVQTAEEKRTGICLVFHFVRKVTNGGKIGHFAKKLQSNLSNNNKGNIRLNERVRHHANGGSFPEEELERSENDTKLEVFFIASRLVGMTAASENSVVIDETVMKVQVNTGADSPVISSSIW